MSAQAATNLAPMISGYWISQAIYVAAKLGIADLLQAGARPAEELAQLTATHPPSLYRLLRALASVGVFAEGEPGHFSLTPLAERLRTDLAESQHALAVMLGEEHYHAWGELLFSVRTGQTGFEKVYSKPIFDYLAEHPDQAAVFDAAMSAIHGPETAAMVEAYDFSGIGLLADIGGGNGSTLRGLLERHPGMHGLLFDLPGVAERAKLAIGAAGLFDRCTVESGSFFDGVPGGAHAYLLRHIIHDWDDEKATAILRTVHVAMSHEAKLLVVESVIPPGNAFFFPKLLDLAMLVLPGGKERTEEEYRRLYEAAGFRLTRVVSTTAEVSVIEGVKA